MNEIINEYELEITKRYLKQYNESYAANYSLMNINPTVNDAFIINDFLVDNNKRQSFHFVESEPKLSHFDPHIPFKNRIVQKKLVVIKKE